jgi:hypothetical protein
MGLLAEGGGVEAGPVAGFLDEEAAGILSVLEDDEVAVGSWDAAETGWGEGEIREVEGVGRGRRESFWCREDEGSSSGVGSDLFKTGSRECRGFGSPDAVRGILRGDEAREVRGQVGSSGACLRLSDAGDPRRSGDESGGGGCHREINPAAAFRVENPRASVGWG